MLMTIGAMLLFLAPLLLVALLIPGAPEIALSRRRPYDTDPPSRLTRLANITVGALDRFLVPERPPLQPGGPKNSGVRLSQAEFIVLVIAGAIVGALVGLVIGVPAVSVLLALLSPFAGHLVLGFLAGSGAPSSTSSSVTPSSSLPAAFGPATVSSGPSTPRLRSPKAPPRRDAARHTETSWAVTCSPPD